MYRIIFLKVLFTFFLCILGIPTFAIMHRETNLKHISTSVKVHKSLWNTFIKYQRKGQIYLNKLLRELRLGFRIKNFLIIILFSFGYGLFHALGPGHGKLIISSFFIQDEKNKEDAFLLSLIVSFIHSFSAIILSVLFKTVLTTIKGFAKIRLQNSFIIISGIIIILIGVLSLIKKIKDKNGKDFENDIKIKIQINKTLRHRLTRNIVLGF